MSQASIASFFTKKPAAAPAAQQGGKQDAAEPAANDSATGMDTTPSLNKTAEQKANDTPPTNTRKRLRQVDSSDSEDDGKAVALPATRDADAMQDAVPGDDVAASCAGASPEKKPKQRASPVKPKASEAGADASVRQFFTKKGPAASKEPAVHTAEKESEKQQSDEALAKNAVTAEVNGQTATTEAKTLTNMEKRKAADKKQRDAAKHEKAKALGKGELAGGWGGQSSAAKPDGDAEDDLSDEEDLMDDEDEDAKQQLLQSCSSFDASKEAKWKKGEPVPYSHLADMFEKVEAITKRLEITAIVTRALRAVIETTPEDLLPVVYLCVNKLAPAHEGVELGLGDMVLEKALGEATGRQPKDIKADYRELGDLGKVANKSRALQRTLFKAKALTVRNVHKSMLQIANMAGKDSGTQKKEKIKGLLVASQGVEAQYIVRQLQGKMRNGLGEQTVLVALAHAVVQSKGGRTKEALESGVQILKEVYCQLPCYDRVIPQLLAEPISELPKTCFLQPGIPVKPMLAHPTKGISEVLDRFEGQTFTCEYKYDGERAQVAHVCLLPGRACYLLFM